MSKGLKNGDHVTCKSDGGTAEVHEITFQRGAAGRKATASKDEPQYLVASDKSGGKAVPEPGALEKQS